MRSEQEILATINSQVKQIFRKKSLFEKLTTKKDPNALDPKRFIPDTTFKMMFPWDDVKKCFNNTLKSEDFFDLYPCPKCRVKPDELKWIFFISPSSTWQKKCGTSGPLSICPNCKIQVQYIVDTIN